MDNEFNNGNGYNGEGNNNQEFNGNNGGYDQNQNVNGYNGGYDQNQNANGYNGAYNQNMNGYNGGYNQNQNMNGYNGGYNQGYGYNNYNDPNQIHKGKATAAKICGILSVIPCCWGWIGIILGIVGVVMAGQYSKATGDADDGSANVGKICGIIGIVCGVVYMILAFTVLNSSGFMEQYQNIIQQAQ